ncbi:hypothetical protein TC41_1306 [Alicyclobacillus acidocaldarius subsp. acidocaldarius Tc-4-1]|uniref:Uncharacterized protein n=1 Tax=Alicyclobacillus acidocaldarius (strain Tc-4-1) TaxID=1048834 RepID=F8IHV4_ALIAT|nr:hypothetical protein TC41_1306 [Alicyclobacillus acidocaldarius subsp. acidocaldarius Tc-4-1]
MSPYGYGAQKNRTNVAMPSADLVPSIRIELRNTFDNVLTG